MMNIDEFKEFVNKHHATDQTLMILLLIRDILRREVVGDSIPVDKLDKAFVDMGIMLVKSRKEQEDGE